MTSPSNPYLLASLTMRQEDRPPLGPWVMRLGSAVLVLSLAASRGLARMELGAHFATCLIQQSDAFDCAVEKGWRCAPRWLQQWLRQVVRAYIHHQGTYRSHGLLQWPLMSCSVKVFPEGAH